MFVVDAHLDLAMNALHWNRDLMRTVADVRVLEQGMEQKGRAAGTVCFPEMRQGEVGLSIATVIARVARPGNPLSGYATAEIAYAVAQGQRHYYTALQEQGCLRLLTDWPSLAEHAQEWGVACEALGLGCPSSSSPNSNSVPDASEDEFDDEDERVLGIILSMEGADPILGPEQIPAWWEQGLRIVGPAPYGVSAYAHGTATPGGLTERGPGLLKAMEAQG